MVAGDGSECAKGKGGRERERRLWARGGEEDEGTRRRGGWEIGAKGRGEEEGEGKGAAARGKRG